MNQRPAIKMGSYLRPPAWSVGTFHVLFCGVDLRDLRAPLLTGALLKSGDPPPLWDCHRPVSGLSLKILP